MKKIIWRLKEQPSPESLWTLVREGILTKDEAREILFSEKTEEDRDLKSLQSEIKFLRELVEKLSSNNSRIVEVIREVEVSVRKYPWYRPYEVWCTAGDNLLNASTTEADGGVTINSMASAETTLQKDFSSIKTFG